MHAFQLHTRLEQDCLVVGHFSLSKLLMMNDKQFPWFILVPQRNHISEIYQLDASDRQQLLTESCVLAEKLTQIYQPDKLNIATIGNLVPQLHVHHIVRYQSDLAWPAPVWGKHPPYPYPEPAAQEAIVCLQKSLQGFLIDH